MARANSTSSLSTAGGQWRGGSGGRPGGLTGQQSAASLREKDLRKMGSSGESARKMHPVTEYRVSSRTAQRLLSAFGKKARWDGQTPGFVLMCPSMSSVCPKLSERLDPYCSERLSRFLVGGALHVTCLQGLLFVEAVEGTNQQIGFRPVEKRPFSARLVNVRSVGSALILEAVGRLMNPEDGNDYVKRSVSFLSHSVNSTVFMFLPRELRPPSNRPLAQTFSNVNVHLGLRVAPSIRRIINDFSELRCF